MHPGALIHKSRGEKVGLGFQCEPSGWGRYPTLLMKPPQTYDRGVYRLKVAVSLMGRLKMPPEELQDRALDHVIMHGRAKEAPLTDCAVINYRLRHVPAEHVNAMRRLNATAIRSNLDLIAAPSG